MKLLCSFGGEFVSQEGKIFYVGGKTRLVTVERSTSFYSLLAKMSMLCNADPCTVDVKFQLPDGSFDTRLVSVETDDDVRNMMDEFDSDRKIPVFLFTDRIRNSVEEEEEYEEGGGDDEDDEGVDDYDDEDENSDGSKMLGADHGTAGSYMFGNKINACGTSNYRKPDSLPGQVSFHHVQNPNPSTPTPQARHLRMGPSMTGDIFRRDSQSLVVGHEYDDVQTFRNALTSAAIASNFELHMIRSDQRRVTARCAAEGCTWRMHASKLPKVSTFRIRTLTPEHTCARSDDVGHRQATAKWIANCVRDKLRQNRNYKPREILNDIHREYGVLITYKRAFLGREKALEELRSELSTNIMSTDNNYETLEKNHCTEDQNWGEIHDPPTKKRSYRACHKEVRPLHCTRCNQIGHNRRTCILPEPMHD